MRLTALRVVLVLLPSVLVASPVDAAGTKRTILVVRTYDAFHVAAADWDGAISGAATILHTAGIRIEWVHCSSYRAGDRPGPPA